MERIMTSNEWRMTHTDTSFRLDFKERIDAQKAFNAMSAAIISIREEDGYADLWLQDLKDCINDNGLEMESTLRSYEVSKYIPAMVEAIAKVFPTVRFTAQATHDSLKCYYVDDYEIDYDGHILTINRTFEDDDCGYFCPKCGEWVAYPNTDKEELEEITECDYCEAHINAWDLKYVPPVTEKTVISIA